MLSAIDGLLVEAERLHAQFLNDLSPWNAEFACWLNACESTIEAIFGSTSEALRSFKGIYFIAPPAEGLADEAERQKAHLAWFDSGLRYAHVKLVGYRYCVERLAIDPPVRTTPYLFLSHGGPTLTHVRALQAFLDAIGLSPIAVLDMPNLNMSVNEKVRHYMGLCTGAIILATAEDETSSGEQRARPNVENEIGMLQAASNVGERIVYLKESDVKFASNYSEKVWIPFQKERIQDAFTQISKELRAFGFLS